MGFNVVDFGSKGPRISGFGPVPKQLYRYMDTNGDGTGTKNAIGDYSASETIFFIQPPAGQVFRIEKVVIFLRGPKADIDLDDYGKNNVLVNGIVVRVCDVDGPVIEYTDGIPIKRWADWAKVGAQIAVPASEASDYRTDKIFDARWLFPEVEGYPLRLNGDKQERFEFVLNDNFSGAINISEHYFIVFGYIEELNGD
jgi:hypothetical protein